MATRLIGTDTADPRLPAVVIAATQGTTASDLAPGDVAANILTDANAYTDEVAAEIVAGGVNFADDAETITGTADNLAVTPAGLAATHIHSVDIREYGLVADGVTNDAPAFNAAITAANASPALGVVILLPPGSINLATGTTAKISRGNVWIRGAGVGVTRLVGWSNTMFTWGDGVSLHTGGGLSDVSIFYIPPNTGSQAILVDCHGKLRFERLELDEVRQLAKLGTSAAAIASGITFADITGSTDPAAGSIVIDACFGDGLYLRDISVYAKGVGFPTNATDPHPASTTTFLRLGQGGWDTVVCRNVLTNRYNIGLAIDVNTAAVVNNLWFSQCIFDYCKTNGILIRTTESTSTVIAAWFTNCWAVATDGNSVELAGTAGMLRNIAFTACIGQQAGKSNWRFAGVALKGIRLLNCNGWGANRLDATNVGADKDDLVIFGSGVSVVGGHFGEDGSAYVGFVNQARYGVVTAPNLDVLEIRDVHAEGATGGFAVSASTTASFSRFIGDNWRTAARPEYATTLAVTAPASDTFLTNVSDHVDEYYVYGGTVSHVYKNSVQIASTTNVSTQLRPGETLVLTYTVAPTVVRVVQP